MLNPGPMQASAFSELDRLYTQILSLYPDSEVLVRTLGVVLVLESLENKRNCEYAKLPSHDSRDNWTRRGKAALGASRVAIHHKGPD